MNTWPQEIISLIYKIMGLDKIISKDTLNASIISNLDLPFESQGLNLTPNYENILGKYINIFKSPLAISEVQIQYVQK